MVKILEMAKAKKNAAAQALVAERWKKSSEEERSDLARQMNESRWKDATEEQRAAIGQRLAAARAKARAKKGIAPKPAKKK